MTKIVDKTQFAAGYGRDSIKPDFSCCAQSVYRDMWSGSGQCSRKNGYGPGHAWCKQHDPFLVKAKADAKREQRLEKWRIEDVEHKFTTDCKNAIKRIAEGTCPNPQATAQAIVSEWTEGTK